MQGRQWFRSHSHMCAGMSLVREYLCSFGWCVDRNQALLESPHLGLVLCASSSAPPPTWVHPPNSAGETKLFTNKKQKKGMEKKKQVSHSNISLQCQLLWLCLWHRF